LREAYLGKGEEAEAAEAEGAEEEVVNPRISADDSTCYTSMDLMIL
jgi:hypothetical protein